jgi:PhnB protein
MSFAGGGGPWGMSAKQLNPYVFPNGDAAEAIALYQAALGAKVESKVTFAEAGMDVPPERRDKLVHAELRVGDSLLMLSDMGEPGPGPAGAPIVQIAVDVGGADDQPACLDVLAAGGKVLMPPHDTFYGGRLAVVVDRFGVHWLLSGMVKA